MYACVVRTFSIELVVDRRRLHLSARTGLAGPGLEADEALDRLARSRAWPDGERKLDLKGSLPWAWAERPHHTADSAEPIM